MGAGRTCVDFGRYPNCRRAIKGLKLPVMGSGFQKTLLLESGLIMGVRVKARDQVKGTTFIQASDDSGLMGW